MGGWDKQVEHRGFLGQWNFSGWHCNEGYDYVCVSHVRAQSCRTLCDPIDNSPPGSFVCGISQARILKWVAISSFRGSSWPREQDTFVQTHKTYDTKDPKSEHFGLCLMMMCQCWFISCNKCPTCWGCWWWGAGPGGAVGVRYISAPSSRFCCEPKTALKIRYLLKSPISFYF